MGERGKEKRKNGDGVGRREELVIWWERICHWRGGEGTEHEAGMRGWRSAAALCEERRALYGEPRGVFTQPLFIAPLEGSARVFCLGSRCPFCYDY